MEERGTRTALFGQGAYFLSFVWWGAGEKIGGKVGRLGEGASLLARRTHLEGRCPNEMGEGLLLEELFLGFGVLGSADPRTSCWRFKLKQLRPRTIICWVPLNSMCLQTPSWDDLHQFKKYRMLDLLGLGLLSWRI